VKGIAAYSSKLDSWVNTWVAEQYGVNKPLIDHGSVEDSVKRLYLNAGFPTPTNVVFAAGPISAKIAEGIAIGVWYLRKNTNAYEDLFGEAFSEVKIQAAVCDACRLIVKAIYDEILESSDNIDIVAQETIKTALEAINPISPHIVLRNTFAEMFFSTIKKMAGKSDIILDSSLLIDDYFIDCKIASLDAQARNTLFSNMQKALPRQSVLSTGTEPVLDYLPVRDTGKVLTDVLSRATIVADKINVMLSDLLDAAEHLATEWVVDRKGVVDAFNYQDFARCVNDIIGTEDSVQHALFDTNRILDIRLPNEDSIQNTITQFLIRCQRRLHAIVWRTSSRIVPTSDTNVALGTFLHDIVGVEVADNVLWKDYGTLATQYTLAHENFCIIADRRPIHLKQDSGRINSTNGPAVVWRDGFSLYYWHGVQVPRSWIDHPETVDPRFALNHPNMEMRRCVAEIVGWKRVLEGIPHKVIDENPNPQIGTLIEVVLPLSESERDEADRGRRFLRVLCGTGREFVLSVPRTMETALQANAWSYNIEPDNYNPEIRT